MNKKNRSQVKTMIAILLVGWQSLLAGPLLMHDKATPLKIVDGDHFIFNKAEPLTSLTHTGPFIRLLDGSLFSVQEQSASFFISKDDGLTWTEHPLLDPEKFSGIGPAPVQTRNGTIIVGFSNIKEMSDLHWNNETNCYDPDAKLPTYITYSRDNGKTWSDPLKLHDAWTGANRAMIETHDGHIVFSTMIMLNYQGRHCVLTYVSSDDGATWKPSNVLDHPSSGGDHSGIMEADIIQLNDGRLWMLIRTNWDYFYESYSSDNGLTWSAYAKTDIDASSAPGKLLRLQSGRIVLIWNRLYHKGKNEIRRWGGVDGEKQLSEVAASWQRDELSLMYSDDDGKTWSSPMIIAENITPTANSWQNWIAYPYAFEHSKGIIWITSDKGFGNLRISIREADLPYCDMTSSMNNQGITPSNFKLDTSPDESEILTVKPLMGDDDVLNVFTLEKTGDFIHVNVYESKNGGVDFCPPRKINSLETITGKWLYLEVTRDKDGSYHFFYLNDGGTFKDTNLLERGESERPSGDDYNGRLINVWYQKCNPTLEKFTKLRMVINGYVGSLNSCITLKSGRILLPVSYLTTRSWSKRDPDIPQFSHYGNFDCSVLYSDDCGESFSMSNSVRVQTPDIVSAYGAVEPVCFERSDGSVDMIIRTQMGVFYRSVSSDGSHYGTPMPTSIINSDSPAGIVRSGSKTVLFYNSCKRYPYAYGGRHVLHAAISDDYLETLRGGREVVRDKFNYEPPPIRGDYGTSYSFPCALPDGRVIVFTGQGKNRGSLSILDTSWLEETSYAADFKCNAIEWHHFGVENIKVDNSGVTIRPSTDAYESAVWNFPALSKGRMDLELEGFELSGTVQLLLTDHFSSPFDEADWLDCVFNVPVQVGNGPAKVRLEFECETGLLNVYCNGALQKSGLRAWKRPHNGINYLRVKTPEFTGKNGWIKLTAACTEACSDF